MTIEYTDADLEKLASISENFNGSMIKAVCTEAGLQAIRRNDEYCSVEDVLLAIYRSQNNLKSSNKTLAVDMYS